MFRKTTMFTQCAGGWGGGGGGGGGSSVPIKSVPHGDMSQELFTHGGFSTAQG